MNYSIFLPLICILNYTWVFFGIPCGNSSVMECESSGLYTKNRFELSQGLTVEVDVLGYAKEGSNFWSGVALNSNVPADNQYAELAITQGIEPFNADVPFVVQLSNGEGLPLEQADSHHWYHFKIVYNRPNVQYWVDDQLMQTVQIDLGDSAVVEYVCVAVNPTTHVEHTIAHCEYRNLRVY